MSIKNRFNKLPYFFKVLFCLGLVVVTLSLAGHLVSAADDYGLGDTVKAAGTGIKKIDSIPNLIGRIIQLVLGFVGTIFFLLMVYAGILWMTARGNEKTAEKAKEMIFQAIIGIVIITAAYALTTTVLGAITGTGDSGTTGPSGKAQGESCTASTECAAGLSCQAETPASQGGCSNSPDFCFTATDCPPGGTCEGATPESGPTTCTP